MSGRKNIPIRIPVEFDNWIKNIQKQLYGETNEIYNKTQIMKMLTNSKVNVRKKKGGEHEVKWNW